MLGSVNSIISEGIARITFHHPKGNSLPGVLLNQLAVEIEKAGSSDQVKVIVLSSTGDGAFCGGASFDELLQIEDEVGGTIFFSGFAKVMMAMIKAPVFVVTKVQGKAVGGGTGLIAASDYVIATRHASLKLSELNLGIGPFVIGPVLEYKIGVSKVMGMTIDREWRTADWAFEAGLYHTIADDSDELDSISEKLISELAEKSSEAISAIKKVHRPNVDNLEKQLADRAALSGRLILSDYSRSFIQEFKKKN